MKKKLMIGLVVLLAVGGYAAKTFLLKTKPAVAKIGGEVYLLPKSFTLNLADGRYATLTVALQLGAGQSDGATAGTPPATDATVGTLPEEAVIRSIITNDVTNETAATLVSATGRQAVEAHILADITAKTDDKVKSVYFTDLAVQ